MFSAPDATFTSSKVIPVYFKVRIAVKFAHFPTTFSDPFFKSGEVSMIGGFSMPLILMNYSEQV
ncbi:MAG: hypothetical protein CME85_06000 [Henriciella sp.]|nr:hypothetical protein [Henriciella sp.]MBF34492.1 hypothetical protein [Hyphomonadaceae bacterium]MBK75037.1 hypothetical protein [Henriciella sp.]PHR76274.1 MAG: hypothetical protein COA64_10980 [Henriciella sp.]